MDAPGLVSYDHYWDRLRNNPSMRTLSGVAEVVEKSNVLEGRIKNAYTRKNLLPLALRIIHALSVHRLTTDDINVPLGATAEELRDDLALHMQLPEQSDAFLLNTVQVALREIMRTVSGQYISFNDGNGQYYLDLKKDVDFEAQIRQRGELMGDDALNRYFFTALGQVMNQPETTYATGHRIWLYQLPWVDKKVNRPGYLFFGAPNDRSTAQPARDFYVYIMPPFGENSWDGETKPDEVLLTLSGLPDKFTELVRQYGGASALGNESATHRAQYMEMATGRGGYLSRLVKWLNENITNHLQVSYEGVNNPVQAILSQTRSSASRTLKELVDVVAAQLLTPQFEEMYPAYPAFSRLSQPVSEEARSANAMDAIRYLAGRGRTALAVNILDGLQLLDNEDNIKPYQSPYAQKYLELLQEKPEGQVVNRGELLDVVAKSVQEDVVKDIPFRLEPEWSAVILMALVYNGDIVLNFGGQKKLDASSIDQAATMAMADLIDFRFYSRPRSLPLGIWTEIFEGLGLQVGLIRDENTREDAVRELQKEVQSELKQVATIQGRIQQGIHLWNRSLFTDRKLVIEKGGTVSSGGSDEVAMPHDIFNPYLRQYKNVLETLSRFNTVGKLRNLKLNAIEVQDAMKGRGALARAETLLKDVERLQPLTTYLVGAQAHMPEESTWGELAVETQQRVIDQLRLAAQGEKATSVQSLQRELQSLKKEYIHAYAAAHRRSVLSADEDNLRREIMDSERWKALQALSQIDLLAANKAEMDGWAQAIAHLRVCRDFHEGMLEESPTCTCQFKPRQATAQPAGELLKTLDQRLTDMVLRWQQALHNGLRSDSAQESIANLTAAEKAPIEIFLTQPDDDPAVPQGLAHAANQALRGIKALPLLENELLEALKAGGMPCTVSDLRSRFNQFLSQAMHGFDATNTRLTLKKESD